MAEIVAFTAEHVCRLTKLSARQLRYWDTTGFFSPEFLDEHRGRVFGRIYSFRDVVGLRTISILRNGHRIPLQELRRVGEWLRTHHETPWSSLRFGLSGRKVVFAASGADVYVQPTAGGQSVFHVTLEVIATDMRQAAGALKQRASAQIGQVVRNRFVVHNAWVVSGTRIPTGAIWNFFAAGYTAAEIVREYPRLTESDVAAAIEFERTKRHAA